MEDTVLGKSRDTGALVRKGADGMRDYHIINIIIVIICVSLLLLVFGYLPLTNEKTSLIRMATRIVNSPAPDLLFVVVSLKLNFFVGERIYINTRLFCYATCILRPSLSWAILRLYFTQV